MFKLNISTSNSPEINTADDLIQQLNRFAEDNKGIFHQAEKKEKGIIEIINGPDKETWFSIFNGIAHLQGRGQISVTLLSEMTKQIADSLQKTN